MLTGSYRLLASDALKPPVTMRACMQSPSNAPSLLASWKGAPPRHGRVRRHALQSVLSVLDDPH
jgi:hypothetical protein